ncbi:ring-opening amidohydrolase [Phreatobacter aquaticus]|uniref:Cyclic amide hydrolase n=1 Tax=Phreatobacter aquaticus TaxID=2570229 RepID=A0A4D7QIV0_9HYPH|nr:ring-opening amidohydrolase [Phreatobacter aquaticus]QCK87590.1 ring-opening amidohydrolase [Phreatobacter aquaticus]
MRADVLRLPMAHPGDLSALDVAIASGRVEAASIVAIIGKTEGNGGVNDFTRGYFTQSLMALLASHTGETAATLAGRIPCVLSGGTEGVLSPHYLVFSRTGDHTSVSTGPALAIGTAFSSPMDPADIGRRAHVESVAAAVRAAMADAGIDDPAEVRLVQVKAPCVTSARAEAARHAGRTVLTADPGRSMAFARAAGTLGVGLALGELSAPSEAAMLSDFTVTCDRASISSGVEVEANEVIVLGNSPTWSGPLRMAHRPMADALDIAAVVAALDDLGLDARPQLTPSDKARIRGVLVKCEPDRRGMIRAQRHTMLDDTDINAQRHIRGAVGGLVAGVIGDTRIFVSGGAEHQGPDGGGLIAIIAEIPGSLS